MGHESFDLSIFHDGVVWSWLGGVSHGMVGWVMKTLIKYKPSS